MTTKVNPNLIDYALLVILAALFGISFMMTKLAVDDVPPFSIAFIRIAIAAAFIYVVMRMKGQSLSALAPHWMLVVLAGLFGNAFPFSLVAWAQGRVDAGLTAIFMAVMPLITLVLAHFFTRDEKLNIFRVIGFCLGLLGVAVLIGFDKLATLGDETLRQYAVMGAAFCYAVNAILSKYLLALPRMAVAAGLLISSAVFLLPFSLYFDQPWQLDISSLSWIMLILLGIFPTALGILLVFVIIQRQGASFLSQINFMVPLFGVFWAVLFISETLPASAAAALIIILAGVAIARIKSTPKINTGVVR